ncbi:KIDINS220, partial [Symbiodinium pilosum]
LATCSELTLTSAPSLQRSDSRKSRRQAATGILQDCYQSAQNAAAHLLHGLSDGEETSREFAHPLTVRLKVSSYSPRDGRDQAEDERKRIEGFVQALRVGDFRKVVDFAEEGVDLTLRTLRGQDVVMLAAASKSSATVSCLRFLLDAKMGIENKDCLGWTPLSHACRNSATQAAEFLLQQRAAVDTQDVAGRTPLMLACMDASAEIPPLLLEAGAQIILQDRRQWTALFYAAERGKQEVVKFLLRKHATPQQTTSEGISALMIAAVRGNTMAAKQLIRRQANLNEVEKNGNTALMLALAAAQQDLVAWLLQEDVDVDISNAIGETAYDIAAEQGFNSLKNTIVMISRIREEARRKAALAAAAAEAAKYMED